MNNHEMPFYYGPVADITTKGLQSRSIIFGMSPICKLATNLSEFIAKHVPCRSGLYLKHEPNVRTLLLDIRMMVPPMQSTVPSAAPVLLSQCVNPDQLKTERLENSLRRCGENWQISSTFSSLIEMAKVPSSSQCSILDNISSVSKIEETELENRFSKLLRLEADKHLP